MMNEETEQFEQRLRRQPMKPVPAEWRAEILAAARDARGGASAERRQQVSLVGGFLPKAATRAWFQNLFWPHPKAWAGLAAVWVLILVLNFSSHDTAPVVAEKTAPPSPEMVAQLRQQQRMLAELIGSREPADADRSKTLAPQPRSGRTILAA
jgi:hypothetical protein